MYVDIVNGIDSGNCQAEPCRTIGYAIGRVSPARDIIKVAAGQSQFGGPTVIDGISVTIMGTAPGTSLRNSPLVIRSTAEVTLHRLTFEASTAGGAVQLIDIGAQPSVVVVESVFQSNPQGAIIAERNGSVTVRRTTFNANATAVSRPIDAGGSSEITNCRFFGNTGAEIVDLVGGPTDVFQFNTIADNSGSVMVNCEANGTEVVNNIIYGNGATTHTIGCLSAFNIMGPDNPLPGNVSVDPGFVDAGNGDYSLRTDSNARGQADPDTIYAGPIGVDFQGESRPRPAAERGDVGSDEVD